MISLTTEEYAEADVIVTKKEVVDGLPTLPLGHVLRHADDEEDENAFRSSLDWD